MQRDAAIGTRQSRVARERHVDHGFDARGSRGRLVESRAVAGRAARRRSDRLVSDDGNIDAMAVKKLLKPTLGYLYRLMFPPATRPTRCSSTASPSTDDSYRVVSFYTPPVRREAIVSWGQVLLDSVERRPW